MDKRNFLVISCASVMGLWSWWSSYQAWPWRCCPPCLAKKALLLSHTIASEALLCCHFPWREKNRMWTAAVRSISQMVPTDPQKPFVLRYSAIWQVLKVWWTHWAVCWLPSTVRLQGDWSVSREKTAHLRQVRLHPGGWTTHQGDIHWRWSECIVYLFFPTCKGDSQVLSIQIDHTKKCQHAAGWHMSLAEFAFLSLHLQSSILKPPSSYIALCTYWVERMPASTKQEPYQIPCPDRFHRNQPKLIEFESYDASTPIGRREQLEKGSGDIA